MYITLCNDFNGKTELLDGATPPITECFKLLFDAPLRQTEGLEGKERKVIDYVEFTCSVTVARLNPWKARNLHMESTWVIRGM